MQVTLLYYGLYMSKGLGPTGKSLSLFSIKRIWLYGG